MNLTDVIQEITTQIDTIDGLRVFDYPPDALSPPACIVFPQTVMFDKTYGRGSDDIVLSGVIVVSRAQDRAAARALYPFSDGSGVQSIKATVEAGIYTAFDFAHVVDFDDFDIIRVGGIDYWGSTFNINVTGRGEVV